MNDSLLRAMYRERSAAYRRFLVPYLRYVFGSGLLLFLGLSVMAGIMYYSSLVRDFPSDFPMPWVAVALLAPVLAFSPLRTFLKSADRIFLLPMEQVMRDYFKIMHRNAYVLQIACTLLVWTILWPLHRLYEELHLRSASLPEYAAVGGMLVGIKVLLLFGSWTERAMMEESTRILFKIVRWCAGILLLVLLFMWHHPLSVVLALVAAFAYIVLLRIPRRHRVHWDYLIALEEAAMSRTYGFLNWFIDVPRDESRSPRRSLWSRLGNRLSLDPRNAYRFLYIKTLVRSDLLSMMIRLLLVFAVVILVFEPIWVDLALYVFAVYVTGVQLSVLAGEHTLISWVHVYPLPQQWRLASAVSVIFRAHVVAAVAVSIPLWWSDTSWMVPVFMLLCGIGLAWVMQFRLRMRKARP